MPIAGEVHADPGLFVEPDTSVRGTALFSGAKIILFAGNVLRASNVLPSTMHAEGSANLGYLKHVLQRLLEQKEGEDDGPLLQVIFTFLQFSESEVSRVVAARAHATRRTSRLSSLFR